MVVCKQKLTLNTKAGGNETLCSSREEKSAGTAQHGSALCSRKRFQGWEQRLCTTPLLLYLLLLSCSKTPSEVWLLQPCNRGHSFIQACLEGRDFTKGFPGAPCLLQVSVFP